MVSFLLSKPPSGAPTTSQNQRPPFKKTTMIFWAEMWFWCWFWSCDLFSWFIFLKLPPVASRGRWPRTSLFCFWSDSSEFWFVNSACGLVYSAVVVQKLAYGSFFQLLSFSLWKIAAQFFIVCLFFQLVRSLRSLTSWKKRLKDFCRRQKSSFSFFLVLFLSLFRAYGPSKEKEKEHDWRNLRSKFLQSCIYLYDNFL